MPLFWGLANTNSTMATLVADEVCLDGVELAFYLFDRPFVHGLGPTDEGRNLFGSGRLRGDQTTVA